MEVSRARIFIAPAFYRPLAAGGGADAARTGNAAPGGARNSALQMGVMGGLAVHVAAGILDVAPQLATLFGDRRRGLRPSSESGGARRRP